MKHSKKWWKEFRDVVLTALEGVDEIPDYIKAMSKEEAKEFEKKVLHEISKTQKRKKAQS